MVSKKVEEILLLMLLIVCSRVSPCSPCLCTYCGGWLRWEQTQLTASFLTVNIAAPLRHGSGTRTAPPPPTYCLTHPPRRVSLSLSPTCKRASPWVRDGNSPSSCSQTCDPTVCITYHLFTNTPHFPGLPHLACTHTHTLHFTPLSWLLADTKGSFRGWKDTVSTACHWSEGSWEINYWFYHYIWIQYLHFSLYYMFIQDLLVVVGKNVIEQWAVLQWFSFPQH